MLSERNIVRITPSKKEQNGPNKGGNKRMAPKPDDQGH